ncbi:MAG: ATP-grasp domain-containing protein [Anaerolineales bacterium]|nr:ATP-grasp domain-containing protein [Anaerolineales bacterium]
MNFVYLSPHFPPNYYLFAVQLNNLGVNVLGLADEPYAHLRPELRSALAEYYKVTDLHQYGELIRACGYFTHRYGKLDRLDSHSEYWLETEAMLRTDFNIPGLKIQDMPKIKRKSSMKQVFIKAGIDVARGKVVHSLAEAKRLIKETGFPVVAKPDIGVGAAKTYKIHSLSELEQFFEQKPPVDYIMEEFITGTICTFDGLTNQEGEVVFFTSHQYSQGIMETVIHDDLIYYYSLREIPADLEEAGRKIVKAFAIKERFFHFEFFRRPDGKLVALEVNIRPPGGMTTDMFNYANDIDIYREWANVIVNNRFQASYSRRYHCGYVGRKFNRPYKHSHEQILEQFGACCIPHHEPISGIFSAALGDYGYLIRSPNLDEIIEMANFIHDHP